MESSGLRQFDFALRFPVATTICLPTFPPFRRSFVFYVASFRAPEYRKRHSCLPQGYRSVILPISAVSYASLERSRGLDFLFPAFSPSFAHAVHTRSLSLVIYFLLLFSTTPESPTNSYMVSVSLTFNSINITKHCLLPLIQGDPGYHSPPEWNLQ